ncbi:MAG TPA: hypothetical protein ENH98_01515 [archaeon]|nr:hypothetical protein [archaeon]
MSITDFGKKLKDEPGRSLEESEIYKYIQDKRILRTLLENRIFHLRKIQEEAIKKGLFFRK